MCQRICWCGASAAGSDVECFVLGICTVGNSVLVDEIVVGSFDVVVVIKLWLVGW